MKKKVVIIGVALSAGIVSSCNQNPRTYEKSTPPLLQGRVLGIDTAKDLITLDTGRLRRSAPSIGIAGALAAQKLPPFTKKGDKIVVMYDTVESKYKVHNILRIVK